jgi:hypothetical protein
VKVRMWRVFALSLGALANGVICEMGAKVRARSTAPLCFFSVYTYTRARSAGALGYGYPTPTSEIKRGAPVFVTRITWTCGGRPLTYLTPQKLSRARMCSLSAHGETSPVNGRFNHKKVV